MEPIAVVGLGCRFPGDATSPEALWDMITNGQSAWSEFPEDRVNISSYFHPSGNRQGSICFRGAHFLKQNVAAFDTAFFSISAEEAKAMDPQQRMLLEVAVEALDNAGVDRNALRKSETGVWIGSFVKDYEQIVLRDPDNSPTYGATGNGIAIMSNRISYFLDINGPSMTIDTGCSASLVCVHNACQSLRDGEIDMALAGGAGLILTPNTMMPMTALNFLSPDGKCYTFDSRANGYGRGEGVGIVIMKRLTDAIRDNDNIRAIIRGSRVNQDGRTPGITLPSAEAQIRNIRATYKRAGLETDKTAFVECHGTGTQAGDSRELKAVSTGLCQERAVDNPMYVGSVKTNIGHLEGCAGIAGLIKGVLTVERGVIPKHINFEAPGNPNINFEDLKVKVPLKNTPWPVAGLRRASVNCFGFGGTNAHVILDDAAHYLAERRLTAHHSTTIVDGIRDPSVHRFMITEAMAEAKARIKNISHHAGGQIVPPRNTTSHLFVFSAHEQQALIRTLENQVHYLQDPNHEFSIDFMESLAYTLGCRRTRMQWRTSVTATSPDELATKLQALTDGELSRVSEDKATRIALVFGGQGAQWFAMGRDLLGFDIFLDSITAASSYMSNKLGSSFRLLDEVLKNEECSQINLPEISQPATTALQVALVDLLTHYYGVVPSSVIGHSSGEIAAAYAAGIITREAAWELAYYRGLWASSLNSLKSTDGGQYPKGRMMAVGLSAEDASVYVDRVACGKAVVACINSPSSVTLSGDEDAILELKQLLTADGVFTRLLVVDIAYHSHHMMRCASEYLHAHEPPQRTAMPTMFSSVNGKPVSWESLTPTYWMINMVSPVRFSDAFEEMMLQPNGKKPDIILEVGPHATLQGSVQQILDVDIRARRKPIYLSLLHRKRGAVATTLEAVGKLWSRGCNICMPWVIMRNIQCSRPRLIVDLPSYAWNHDTLYWHESHLSRANRFQVHGRYDLIGRPTADSVPFQPRWRGFFRVHENPWLVDHQVQKTIVYPAAGMVSMVLEGAKQVTPGNFVGLEISQFQIEKAMLIPSNEHGLEHALNLNKIVTGHYAGVQNAGCGSQYGTSPLSTAYEFFIYSKPLGSAWQQHGHGIVTIYTENDDTNHSRQGVIVDVQTSRAQSYHQRYLQAVDFCDESLIPRQFYESLDTIGMNYGPLFQNIASIAKRDSICHFAVRIPDTKSSMPAQFEYPHIIHPATLDSVFQTAFAFGGESMVPSRIGSLYISADMASLSKSGQDLVGFTEAKHHGVREASVNFTVADASWGDTHLPAAMDPLVVITDMEFTTLVADEDTADTLFLPNHRNLCSQIVWKPFDSAQEAGQKATPTNEAVEPEEVTGGVFLLVPDSPDLWLSQVCEQISQKLHCSIIPLSSITDATELPKHCLSLLEFLPEQHVIWDISKQTYSALRRVIDSTKVIFWVTQGGQIEALNPKDSLFQALARTIHSENPHKRLISFDMDVQKASKTSEAAQTIVKLFRHSVLDHSGLEPAETEYAEREGKLLVPRLVTVDNLNRLIEGDRIKQKPQLESFSQNNDRALQLRVGEIKQPENLYWDDDTSAHTPLPPNYVTIKVLSAGLSCLDVCTVLDTSGDGLLGTGAYGIIESCGPNTSPYAIGDHVLAVVRGSLRQHLRCHSDLITKLDHSPSNAMLAPVATTYAIASYISHRTARLTRDHTILVQAGASLLGLAMVSMAEKIGTKVYATVANEQQRKVLREFYFMADECILEAKDESLVDSIMRLTNNAGVDAVFDPNNEHQESSLQCIGEAGHIISLSKMGGDMQTPRFGGRSITYSVVDVANLVEKDPCRLGESLKTWRNFHQRYLRPFLDSEDGARQYSYADIPKAMRSLAEAGYIGAAYCVTSETNTIPILPRCKRPVKQFLRGDATYLLAGQGGLAMQIARLLEANGVKNIAMLSRSGATSDASKSTVAFLRNRGVRVHIVKVDICDRDTLRAAVRDIQQTMPPIRGLFQCAAVIRDGVFDTMAYDDWQTAIRPKTIGSWNLFELCPQDMDFFIFLSSAAGVIGNRGQANYAVGNAFQDALARHICNLGSMRAVSLDLGPILGAGMLAEDPRTLDLLKASGFFGIRLKDFECIVECAITGYTQGDEYTPSQIVLGVGTGGLIRQNNPADPYWTRTALFSLLNKVDLPAEMFEASTDAREVEQSTKSLLKQVADNEEAQEIIDISLCRMLAATTNMVAQDVDDGKPPSAYGVDSLIAVGVRNWVFRECGVEISIFEVLSDTSIFDLSRIIAQKGGFGMVTA
ncbi:hypothetical protein BX600DRAFT_414262 [Xylariales sp. PMI_506]|nr:hypothetical protein BX600DRAFT_414262 [Xylariales sp. PMI_506]